jgi:hypothetical protein
MKRTLFALFAASLVAASTGCGCFRTMIAHQCGNCEQDCPNGDCDSCGPHGEYDPGKYGYSDCSDYGCRAGCNETCCQRHCDCVGCSGHCMPCTKWGERMAMQGPMPLEYGQGGLQEGPATGAVTYPYYTTRGPRDFLAKNPGTIGP